MATVKPTYSDFNEFQVSGSLLYDIADIYQSIDNILNTVPGERLFLPEFGCDLERYLFQLISEETGFSILGEVVKAINRWEPRVVVNFGQSSVVPNGSENGYNCVASFVIIGLGGQQFAYQAGITR
jgi:phage baseplate assembly protein W